MAILVTGGAGYIGSHTCVELLNSGYDVVVVDNLVNSVEASIKRVEQICGKNITLYSYDCCDKEKMREIFSKENIDAVIHFAGLKAVGESVHKPIEYYYNNITSTLVLCDVMREFNCKNIVFSSSATVYGDAKQIPITEECPKGTPTNPYGHTKSMIEQMFLDIFKSDKEWNIVLLRYFNPIGAHESGMIGEDPKGIPNNLFPYITQVAVGKLEELSIFGKDYNTVDGTCVRDYIHVVDLAAGHVKALDKIFKGLDDVGIYNLGTGVGTSVYEIVKAFEETIGIKLKYSFKGRRDGDVAISYADPSKANRELSWIAQRDIRCMCRDAWNWQKNNPEGYNK